MKFLDDKKRIRRNLVDKKAEDTAKSITSSGKLTSHQLRRFYNEFKTLERKLDHKTANRKVDEQEAFAEVLPLVMLNIPKLLYARNRNLVPLEFVDWLQDCLDSIKDDVKNFRAFMLHFEAVVGYCYGTGKLKN